MPRCEELLQRIPYTCIQGSMDREVREVVYDSHKVTEGCLFVCICGYRADGHEYAAEAVRGGAVALVVSREVELPEQDKVTVILVEDTRYALAWISAAFFGYPADRLKVVGVTGTKGKTTTTYLMKSILEQAGYRVGLIGTIEVLIGEKRLSADNTTPESFLLQQYFKEMEEAGCQIVVMEAASQGFKLYRTQGFVFEIGVFTNLESDHIGPGEHADFREYLACKSLLFRQCRLGIVNGDDAHAGEVTERHTCRLESYGFDPSFDLYAQEVSLVNRQGEPGVRFRVRGRSRGEEPPMDMQVELPVPGRFSVYNGLAAIAVSRHFGAGERAIREGLLRTHVKGRLERVPVPYPFTLLIDYAHNAMSLKSLLITLQEYHPARLVCLFGCGGNRSRQRRFEMGEVSGTYADLTIITSDNPRFEEPQAIIEDIKSGICKTKGSYIEICDRKEAIAYAITHGQPGDIIVLAGKGHEDYQEIQGVKYPMDERKLVAEIVCRQNQDGAQEQDGRKNGKGGFEGGRMQKGAS